MLATGSLSPLVAAPLGIHLQIYPAQGCSVAMPVLAPKMAHQVSLAADEFTLVFSRLGDQLRIAGTAEFNGDDRHLNPLRCQAIMQRVEVLFAGAGDISQAQFRTGRRPATPCIDSRRAIRRLDAHAEGATRQRSMPAGY